MVIDKRDFTGEVHAIIAKAAQSLDALHRSEGDNFASEARRVAVIIGDSSRCLDGMVANVPVYDPTIENEDLNDG